MAPPRKDERISCSAELSAQGCSDAQASSCDNEGCKLPAAAEACLAEAAPCLAEYFEEANSAPGVRGVWDGMDVSAADVERAVPLLAVLGYEHWEIAELHADAMTLGMEEVMRHLPADVGLRPRAALVRVLGKVVPSA